nr:hypothetical protein CFP56_58096 [Quercus suber]
MRLGKMYTQSAISECAIRLRTTLSTSIRTQLFSLNHENLKFRWNQEQRDGDAKPSVRYTSVDHTQATASGVQSCTNHPMHYALPAASLSFRESSLYRRRGRRLPQRYSGMSIAKRGLVAWYQACCVAKHPLLHLSLPNIVAAGMRSTLPKQRAPTYPAFVATA